MLNVSNDFDTAVKANSMSSDALVIVDFGPELDYPFASVVASTTAANFYADQVCDGVLDYLDRAYTGNYIPALFNDPLVGWKGTYQANGSGTLSTQETLEITYTEEITTGNFFVVGTEENYPVDFTIETYDSGWSTLVTVTDNDAPLYSYNTGELSFTKVRVTITKISLASDYAHVLEAGAVLCVCATRNDIKELDLLEEAFPESDVPLGRISANNFSVTLYNQDGRYNPSNSYSYLHGLMRPKLRLRPYVGVEVAEDEYECVPLGIFWTEDWSVPSKQSLFVTLNCFDRLHKTVDIAYPQLAPTNGKE
jgi:hypothetical protein